MLLPSVRYTTQKQSTKKFTGKSWELLNGLQWKHFNLIFIRCVYYASNLFQMFLPLVSEFQTKCIEKVGYQMYRTFSQFIKNQLFLELFDFFQILAPIDPVILEFCRGQIDGQTDRHSCFTNRVSVFVKQLDRCKRSVLPTICHCTFKCSVIGCINKLSNIYCKKFYSNQVSWSLWPLLFC